MWDIGRKQKALVRRILEGDGNASQSDRRAAFNNTGLAEPVHGEFLKLGEMKDLRRLVGLAGCGISWSFWLT